MGKVLSGSLGWNPCSRVPAPGSRVLALGFGL